MSVVAMLFTQNDTVEPHKRIYFYKNLDAEVQYFKAPK